MADCQQTELQDDRAIIIASNRGPITFHRDDQGELVFQRGSGGLVTALAGLTRQINATWISCAQTEEDAAWSEGLIPLLKDESGLYIKFLAPETSMYEGYYNVISNPLLWFLQHSMWDVPRAPLINRATWQAWEDGYVRVNRLYAEEITNQVRKIAQPVLVMLQDYHLYLAARYIARKFTRKSKPTILHFIHIPWPGTEYWSILPPTMRQAILDGLCAVDVLGFQTREDGLNFIRTCQSFLPGASVNYKHSRIWYRNHSTYVRDFPISIDTKSIQELANSPEVLDYQEELIDIIGEKKVILRVDRIEPSKNILRGFQAFEEMLDLYPEHHKKAMFLALLVPSRMDVEEYQNYLDEIMAAAGRTNAKYSDHDWEPVRILVGEDYPRAVAALKLYDVLLVNSIADGMNLVAKEGPMVNQRDGVLILSERAGARQQLESGATIISPCDVYATAEAMHHAFVMLEEERASRAARLRWLIEREDINDWFCRQLDTVADLSL